MCLAVYYGQGAGSLSSLCADDTIDAIPLAFLNKFFSDGGKPEIDMSGICGASNSFPGTRLANCQILAEDIKACQAKGKIVTLSLGGGGASTGFSSDSQAEAFADTIWDLLLGGKSDTRPFGTAVLDGIDLDIEDGTPAGYAAFVNKLRSKAKGDSKKYYFTAAPQCVFPDAHLGGVLDAVGFDAVYVQAYGSDSWNFDTWDKWAKNTSPNKNIKVYIGAPASAAAGGGYIGVDVLSKIAAETAAKYSSFGGIMLWDASQAKANGGFDKQIKSALKSGGSGSGSTDPPPPPPPTADPSTSGPQDPMTVTPAPGDPKATTPSTNTGSCAGVDPWGAGTAYTANQQVSYSGHTWTAQWETTGDTPGGLSTLLHSININ
ncbi:hypothetical protein DXG01_004423 [Tephrocybe rancida]|nr:hypothetical protein DXG01_004423 [Tephrocybe rancida]